MSGAILSTIFIAVLIAFCIIYYEGKKSGDQEATRRMESQYGSINECKRNADKQIARLKDAFEKECAQIRESVRWHTIKEQEEKTAKMLSACNTEIASRKKAAENKLRQIEKDIELTQSKHSVILGGIEEFKSGILSTRKWLAQNIADIIAAKHDLLEQQKLKAPSTTEKHQKLKKEHRDLLEKYAFLEAQLASYKEYFPFLDEYEELILDERIDVSSLSDSEKSSTIDKAMLFLDKEEYDKLSEGEKYQLALDRYKKRNMNNWEIGRHYERYIGYKYESEGWDVIYHGAIKGFEDMGRDLVCSKGKQIHIVQAKCWSKSKTIHEKHIFQLYGTTLLFEMTQKLSKTPKAVFVTTTQLSDVAREAASRLGITIRNVDLSLDYPMIKCNISRGDKEKIYHLPFDQQYDRIKIDDPGECYAMTVKDAEDKGFRRAKKYFGTNTTVSI